MPELPEAAAQVGVLDGRHSGAYIGFGRGHERPLSDRVRRHDQGFRRAQPVD